MDLLEELRARAIQVMRAEVGVRVLVTVLERR